MNISVLLAPTSKTYQRLPIPSPPRTTSLARAQIDWEDMARKKMWSQAILAYLRQNWRQGIPIWRLLSQIVGESLPANRAETRASTKSALAALMALVRLKKVIRYRQKTVAILDLQ